MGLAFLITHLTESFADAPTSPNMTTRRTAASTVCAQSWP